LQILGTIPQDLVTQKAKTPTFCNTGDQRVLVCRSFAKALGMIIQDWNLTNLKNATESSERLQHEASTPGMFLFVIVLNEGSRKEGSSKLDCYCSSYDGCSHEFSEIFSNDRFFLLHGTRNNPILFLLAHILITLNSS
jgi:hypothetical protein